MAYWKQLPVKEISIGGFKGLDESLPSSKRPLGTLSVMSNLVVDPATVLSTIPGLTAKGSAIAATVTRGIHQYSSVDGATVQTLAQAGCVLKYWNGSTWTSINAGTVASITVTAGGSAYTSPPTVVFTGGGGSAAAGTAVLTGDAVTSVTITNAGTGYITTPTISFTGGGGSGAAGTAVMTIPDVAMTAANLGDYACLFWAGYAPRKWSGSALTALGGSPPQGEFAIEAYNRVFVAGIDGREGDVDCCSVLLPETWTPAASNTAASFTVSTNPVKWLCFDRIQGKVIIWTTKDLLVFNGPETPNLPDLWTTRTAAPFGTPNGRTVQIVNGVWIWLTNSAGRKGFAMWSGGSAEVVEKPLETSLDLIDWSTISTSASWVDNKNRYHCKTPKTSGYQEFVYDPVTNGWSVGSSKDIRASGVMTVSGSDVSLVGNEVGAMYTTTGTDNGGTDISWSATAGASTLGSPFADKEILNVTVILTLAAGATANLAVAATETGAYGTTRTLSATTELTRIKVQLPFAAGDPRKGGVFRLKAWGTGVATLEDVLLRVYEHRT